MNGICFRFVCVSVCVSVVDVNEHAGSECLHERRCIFIPVEWLLAPD